MKTEKKKIPVYFTNLKLRDSRPCLPRPPFSLNCHTSKKLTLTCHQSRKGHIKSCSCQPRPSL